MTHPLLCEALEFTFLLNLHFSPHCFHLPTKKKCAACETPVLKYLLFSVTEQDESMFPYVICSVHWSFLLQIWSNQPACSPLLWNFSFFCFPKYYWQHCAYCSRWLINNSIFWSPCLSIYRHRHHTKHLEMHDGICAMAQTHTVYAHWESSQSTNKAFPLPNVIRCFHITIVSATAIMSYTSRVY